MYCHITLRTVDAFSLYLAVQAPQVVRGSISPTGLVDPRETQWSVEFDRQVSSLFIQLTGFNTA